jgi:hypothetical protein
MQFPPEEGGKPFQCPRCEFVSKVPAPFPPSANAQRLLTRSLPQPRLREEPAPAPPDDVALPSESVPDLPSDWRLVACGIHLIYLAVWLVVASVVVVVGVSLAAEYVLGWKVDPARAGAAARQLTTLTNGLVLLLLALVGVAYVAMILIGHSLCLLIPARAGATGLAIAVLILAAVGLAGNVLASLLTPNPMLPDLDALLAAGLPRILLGLAALLVGVAQWFTFLFFLRKVADYFGARWLARSLVNLMFTSAVVGLALLVAAAAALFVRKLGPPPTASFLTKGLMMLGGVLLVVVTGWYLIVLRYCRNLIQRETTRGGSE